MHTRSNRTDPPETALITGASSGIRAAFARILAGHGYDVILVARREARLVALASELEQHGITAEILVADLASPAGVLRVEARIATTPALTMLINNAGTGTTGSFAESDPSRQLDMIRLHVIASVRLMHAVLPGMIARGRGWIINVASIGAFVPSASNVSYNATKAFLTSFCIAPNDEVRDAGIRVQALCPGFTLTEFHDRLGSSRYSTLALDVTRRGCLRVAASARPRSAGLCSRHQEPCADRPCPQSAHGPTPASPDSRCGTTRRWYV